MQMTTASSSIKLVQQQVKGFIQGLSSTELLLLLDTFKQSQPVNCACKMVQYKCFESKLELDGKIGCGFGRSQEEALALSVKDFFEVILLEDKYLYLVKDCFKEMKTQQQGSTTTTTTTTGIVELQGQEELQQNYQQEKPILSGRGSQKRIIEKEQNQQQNIIKQKSSNIPQEAIVSVDNTSLLLISSSLAGLDETANNRSLYTSGHDELSMKIGNISVINPGNPIQSLNTYNNINNSHLDIDEMLQKIVFADDENNNLFKKNNKNNNLQQTTSSASSQQLQQPLTQFQIYQMEQLQIQQQQQQQQMQNNKFQSSKSQLNRQGQPQFGQLQEVKQQIFSKMRQHENEFEGDLQTPPRKRYASSALNNHHSNNCQGAAVVAPGVNQQLNDTAFLPINKKSSSNNNVNIKNNQQIIKNQQQQSNTNYVSQQFSNKENAFGSNQSIYNNTNKQALASTLSSAQLNSKNQFLNGFSSTCQISGNISGHQSSVFGCINNSSCQHKEDLERERQKNENLEKKLKLLLEENKILKSLLLDSQDTSKGDNHGINNYLEIANKEIPFCIGNVSDQRDQYNLSIANHQENNTEGGGGYGKRSQSYEPTNSNGKRPKINMIQPNQGNYVSTMNNKDMVGYEQAANNFLNLSDQNHSSVKKPIPKLNLEVLPNYHGKIYKSNNYNNNKQQLQNAILNTQNQ